MKGIEYVQGIIHLANSAVRYLIINSQSAANVIIIWGVAWMCVRACVRVCVCVWCVVLCCCVCVCDEKNTSVGLCKPPGLLRHQ